MRSPASVKGDDQSHRLRLFVGFPLPAATARTLVEWQREVLGAPSTARLVQPGNLHVTAVFLGSRAQSDAMAVGEILHEAVRGSPIPLLLCERYQETPRVGMLVLRDIGGVATTLTQTLAKRLSAAGLLEPGTRPWLPHISVVRFWERQQLAPILPELGEISPSEVALYHSVLRPDGAQYQVRQSVALGR